MAGNVFSIVYAAKILYGLGVGNARLQTPSIVQEYCTCEY